MLETIEVETAVMPNAAVIWLHGLGADGHEDGCVDDAVSSREAAATSFGRRVSF